MDYDPSESLRRRVYCQQLHVACLEQLLLCPSSIQPEIERRQFLISTAEASIELHKQRIAQLEQQRDNASTLLAIALAELRELKRRANTQLIEKLKQEYFKLHLALEENNDPLVDEKAGSATLS